MARLIKTFEKDDYFGIYNLLKAEKELILKALIRCDADLIQAHRMLCPTNIPYYSIDYLELRIKQHKINLEAVKYAKKPSKTNLTTPHIKQRTEREIIESDVVKERLLRIAKESNIKLRSVK